MAMISENTNVSTVAVGEMTLFGAIRELTKVSWKLKELVYGEKPEKADEAEPQPADNITWARNNIVDTTKRLRDIAERLEIIGK